VVIRQRQSQRGVQVCEIYSFGPVQGSPDIGEAVDDCLDLRSAQVFVPRSRFRRTLLPHCQVVLLPQLGRIPSCVKCPTQPLHRSLGCGDTTLRLSRPTKVPRRFRPRRPAR